jgi:4-hydroxyphenylpyruvate dioxygenase
MEPVISEDQGGRVTRATIEAFGDVVHTFVQRDGYTGPFLPGYRAVGSLFPPSLTLLEELDHVAISVPQGMLDQLADFYKRVLHFQEVHEETVITEYSGMNSKVLQNSSGTIKFPISEPIPGKRRSQTEEFLMFHGGSGVQHLALSSQDIIRTLRLLRTNGIEFLSAPDSYYDLLEARVGTISEDISALREQHILVDRDEWGYLLQIFSKPLQSRPTFFFEVIQRREALGFGSGNIKALFQAIEREQALRGTL